MRKKRKKFNASVHGAYHIIRGFYSHNDINTQKIRTPKVDPSEVQFSNDRVPLFDIVEIEKDGRKVKDKQLRRDFLKSFFECLSPRDKLIAKNGLKTYDRVLANFPFSMDWNNSNADKDPYDRFRYGIPPSKDKADFAFILHMLASLNEKGQVGVLSKVLQYSPTDSSS